MDFAIVKIAGKQFLVREGDKISVEANLGKTGQEIDLSDVLLQHVGDNLQIGRPVVSGSQVKAKVVSSELGDKIRISKFKAKSRYRRVIGFRPQMTTIEITKVSTKEEKAVDVPKIVKPKAKKSSRK